MKLQLHHIIIIAICVILGNQVIHLYHLYKDGKNRYTHQCNELIRDAIYIFNLKASNIANGDALSLDAEKDLLTFRINEKITHFQLTTKDYIATIRTRGCYDLRDPQKWTLKNFNSYLQTKLDSIQLKIPALQLVIQDSSGQIKDSYPEHPETVSASPEYGEPLGFISGDTLYAMYNYPMSQFVRAVLEQIILTLVFSILFVICIIKLNRTIRDEKRRGKYREAFIHNLVHDLKRPVENQITICSLLPSLSPAKQQTFLKSNQRQLNKMLQSINRMLLQSTDAQGLRLNIKEFNLKETLEILIQKEHWTTYSGKLFDIQLDFQSDNPFITGDYHFLYAVFYNLIDNALKYSDAQVNVRITCKDLDDQRLQINIKDNGFGISSQNQKHVFERFNRGDHQSNKKIGGHGLGLYYARMVILAHKGTISIDSEEGKGTTLLITLQRKNKNARKHE